MTPRVAILHHGFIPPYRRAFFELLDRRSPLEYVVFHGAPPTGTGHRAALGPLAFRNVAVHNLELTIAGRTLVYQPVLRRLLSDSFAGAVLGAELKLASNLALWPLLKLRRRPVILWGQGFDKAEDRGGVGSALGSAGTRVKTFAARHADSYLVYTERGAERLVEAGVERGRISVVRNTIDVESEIELHGRLEAADPGRLRSQRGLRPESLVLLYVGRLYTEKRVPELIAAMRALRASGLGPDELEAVIVGDGPELQRVREEARDVPGVHVVGAVYDREEVAAYMRVAAALVIPGKVGLAVNHAFAHGLPVLTRASRLHAPEIEYVCTGQNGLVIPGDEREFIDALLRFARDRELRERLSEGALRTRSELGLAEMVRAFDDGVRRAIEAAAH